MKNWNKISQYIAASAGAALLASFATLATPKTASAATLSFDESSQQWVSDNEAEAVSQIMNLDIGGTKYNVTFESKSYGSLLEEQQQGIGAFGYTNSGTAESAAEAIMNALGDSYYTENFGDSFLVAKRVTNFFGELVWERYEEVKSELDEDLIESAESWMGLYTSNVTRKVEAAVFALAEVGGGAAAGVVSTPEPSLIFGFITLGGLMLGSNARKNKS